MNDKKKLDFDFFSQDSSKKNDSKTVEAVEPTSAISSAENLSFVEYFKGCYSDFVGFSKQYLAQEKPRYLLIVAWLVGVGTVADRVTGQDYTSWGEVWAVALFGGIISGALIYYIAGWFYNLRIKWSKGHENINTSRNIYVFASLPVAIASITALFFNHISYGSDYFDYYYSDGTTIDGVFLFVALAAIIYSIRLGYKAATEVLGAQKNRAIGWFVVLPTLFYIVVIVAVFVSV